MTRILIIIIIIGLFSCSKKHDGKPQYLMTSDSVKIMYVDLGNPNNPPLIISHGAGDNSFNLQVFAKRLTDKFRVILYDERGTGMSSRLLPDSKMKMNNFVQDIYELQNALKINACFHLGHSFGGALVSEFALKYPGKVSRLILVNPLTVTKTLWLDRANAVYKYATENKDSLALKAIAKCQNGDSLTIDDEYQIVKEQRVMCYNPAIVDSMLKLVDYKSLGYNDTTISTDMELIIAEKKATHNYSVLTRIQKVTCPTLIIGGTHDNAITVRQLQKLHSLISNSQIKVIQNCGHTPYMDKPNDLESIIEEFLK